MEAFLISMSSVATAEIGDRTQLLAMVLATRYRRPWPVLAGIVCATAANHAIAALVGIGIGGLLTQSRLDALVGVSMIAMALWTLKPDEAVGGAPSASGTSAFAATTAAFFLAEIGDKTQIATLALAAAYRDLGAVVAGTTTGMLLANAPVVFIGNAFAARLPLRAIHLAASALFLVIGCLFLWRAARHMTTI